MRYTIGQLARRTGLTVKAIRFYADRGIVPPTGRSPSGHREYSAEAQARLELVQALRSLGFGLRTVRTVLYEETPLAEAAATQAAALAEQIQTLRRQHALLESMTRAPEPPVSAGLPAGIVRTLTPELPANPSAAQLAAWLELTEMMQDNDFRAAMHQMSTHYENRPLQPDAAALVRDNADLSVDPASSQAAAIATRIMATADVSHLESVNDPRRDRYVELLATINGWSRPEPLAPALTWFAETRKAHQI